MTTLAPFLSKRSGVYLVPADIHGLEDAARDRNLAWSIVDLGNVSGKEALMSAFAAALEAPPSFGRNWDALADVLGDLSWRPAAGFVLHIARASAFASASPAEWATLLEVLRDAAMYWRDKSVPFFALFETDAPLPGLAAPFYKLPVSVLVLVHTPDLQVLLLERADRPGFWQSVTGSQDAGESLAETAVRELEEETGIRVDPAHLRNWDKQNQYEIYQRWRHRYAPGVTHNVEHVFSVEVPAPAPVRIAPDEHLGYEWLPWNDALQKVFSWSNAEAIRELPERTARPKS